MKAIQATFYSNVGYPTKQLRDNGFEFICRDVVNGFCGTEVTVIVPSGKGKNKKIEQINEILGRGINIYLSSKKFYAQFPNYAG